MRLDILTTFYSVLIAGFLTLALEARADGLCQGLPTFVTTCVPLSPVSTTATLWERQVDHNKAQERAKVVLVAEAHLEGEDILSPDSVYAGTEELRIFKQYQWRMIKDFLYEHWNQRRVARPGRYGRPEYGPEDYMEGSTIPSTPLHRYLYKEIGTGYVVRENPFENFGAENLIEEVPVSRIEVLVGEFLERYPQKALDVAAKRIVGE